MRSSKAKPSPILFVMRSSKKIETQDDLAALRAAVEEDDGTRYTHAQVLAELGL